MELNKDVYISYHSYRTKIKGIISEKLYPESPKDYIGDELLGTPVGHIIYDAMPIKNIFLNSKDDDLFDFIGHAKLIAMLGTYGSGKFLKDIEPTIYVHHSGGQWTARDATSKRYAVLQIRLDIVNYLLKKKDYRRVEIAIKPLKDRIEQLIGNSNINFQAIFNSNMFLLSYRGIKLEFVYGPIIGKLKSIFKKSK